MGRFFEIFRKNHSYTNLTQLLRAICSQDIKGTPAALGSTPNKCLYFKIILFKFLFIFPKRIFIYISNQEMYFFFNFQCNQINTYLLVIIIVWTKKSRCHVSILCLYKFGAFDYMVFICIGLFVNSFKFLL